MYSSAATGPQAVGRELLTTWWNTGGVNGPLGWPTAHSGAVPGGGTGRAFQGGSVYWSAGTGAHWLTGDVRLKWWNTGGTTGVLGFPTADLVSVAGGTGARFQGGSIYSSPSTGARTVRGVDADWLARGGPAGVLGFPTADTADGHRRRRVRRPGHDVQRGHAVHLVGDEAGAALRGHAHRLRGGRGPGAVRVPAGRPGAGTRWRRRGTAVRRPLLVARRGRAPGAGRVAGAWWARGGISGPLGFPTADTAPVTGGGGAAGEMGEFSGGTLYTSTATKPAVLSGDVLAAYEAAGGPAPYGFPVADQTAVTGGEVVGLQYATIYSSPGTGAHLVWGASRAAWWARGELASPLGFPTSDTTVVTGGGGVSGLVTEFTGGALYTSSATKPAVLSGDVLAAYKAAGAPRCTASPSPTRAR